MDDPKYEIRCPHCLEEMDFLENPRALPCGHIFCFDCLTNKSSTRSDGVDVTCSICSKSFAFSDLESLPKPEVPGTNGQKTGGETSEEPPQKKMKTDSDDIVQKSKCDRCKEETIAVCYCTVCAKKLCQHHKELHDGYFDAEADEESHNIVTINKYMETPQKYFKPKCPTHKCDIGMCCKRCFTFKCPLCITTCQCEGDVDHVFLTLSDVDAKLKAQFQAVLKKCAARLSEMCMFEKKTWLKLDTVEEECELLSQSVVKKTYELKASIDAAGKKMLDTIHEYLELRQAMVESTLSETRQSREEIEVKRGLCQQFIRRSHPYDIIQKRDTVLDLKADISKQLPKCNLNTASLKIAMVKFLDASTEKMTRPDSLVLACTRLTSKRCKSISYSEKGELFVVSGDELNVYHKNAELCKTWRQEMPQILSATTCVGDSEQAQGSRPIIILEKQPENKALIRVLKHDHNAVDVCTSQSCDQREFDESTALCAIDYPRDATNSPSISASQGLIATNVCNSITMIDIAKKHKTCFRVKYFPTSVCFAPSSRVLFATGSDKVVCYEIGENLKTKQLWSRYIRGASAVCVMDDGLIAVRSHKDPAISLMNNDGTFDDVLTHEAIIPSLGGMSTHKNYLALAPTEGKTVQIFTVM